MDRITQMRKALSRLDTRSLSPEQQRAVASARSLVETSFSESLIPLDGSYTTTNAWLWGLATFSSVVGIQSPLEIFGALFAHWLFINVSSSLDIWSKGEGRGPSVFYMFLSGVRSQKIWQKGGSNQWMYVIAPLIATFYDFMDKENRNKFTIWEHILADLLGGAFVIFKIL